MKYSPVIQPHRIIDRRIDYLPRCFARFVVSQQPRYMTADCGQTRRSIDPGEDLELYE